MREIFKYLSSLVSLDLINFCDSFIRLRNIYLYVKTVEKIVTRNFDAEINFEIYKKVNE